MELSSSSFYNVKLSEWNCHSGFFRNAIAFSETQCFFRTLFYTLHNLLFYFSEHYIFSEPKPQTAIGLTGGHIGNGRPLKKLYVFPGFFIFALSSKLHSENVLFVFQFITESINYINASMHENLQKRTQVSKHRQKWPHAQR